MNIISNTCLALLLSSATHGFAATLEHAEHAEHAAPSVPLVQAHSVAQHPSDQHQMGQQIFWKFNAEAVEVQRHDGDWKGHYDVEFWIGSDWHRLKLASEGVLAENRLQHAEHATLWWQPISAFWNGAVGVHYDEDAARSSIAVEVEGTAPYWVETSVQLRLAEQGHHALQVELAHDLQLTRRFKLSNQLETRVYGKADLIAQQGAGLSDIELTSRLSYQVNPQLLPYIGVRGQRFFAETARFKQQAGQPRQDNQLIVGLSFWF